MAHMVVPVKFPRRYGLSILAGHRPNGLRVRTSPHSYLCTRAPMSVHRSVHASLHRPIHMSVRVHKNRPSDAATFI